MTCEASLAQASAMLQRRGRLTYGALKRPVQLDATYLEAVKAERSEGQRVAGDEAGRVLVWTGAAGTRLSPGLSASPPGPQPAPPAPARPPPAPPPAVPPTPETERRQLTVLGYALVDSTGLASHLNPEEWRAVVRADQAACTKGIARFAGHIAQDLGDGVLVYFGAPQAHDDDAQRAVRAGLGSVEAVRLGLHTGRVVVGDMGGGPRPEQWALGEPPNRAARLHGIAAPTTLVISAATFQLLGGFFARQPLGRPRLPGPAHPLAVSRVL